MTQLAKALLICLVAFAPVLAQTPEDIAREAGIGAVEIVDTSPRAQLWADIVAARRAENLALYETLTSQYNHLYANAFSRVAPAPDDPYAVLPGLSNGNGTSNDWGPGDVPISPADILSPLTAGNTKSLRLRVDSLGNKYVAYIASNRDSICVFRSTDQGLSWTRLLNISPGGTTKWHSFDFFVTDSVNNHVLGFTAVRTTAASGYGGQLFWFSCLENGSGFRATGIATRPAGRGHINPAVVSDGYMWSAGLTYWYAAFQNVDSTTGVGNQALASFSTNWGVTWALDTARNSFNDFDLDIDYNFRSDTIGVVLTNDITATNPNLRMQRIPLSGLGTGSTWSQINVANTADPEFGTSFVASRQNNALMVMFTRTQAGVDNIGYATSPTGAWALANWTLDQILQPQANNQQRADLDCQEAQSAFRVAYVSKGPSRDTVIYTSAFNPPFTARQIVNENRNASTSTAPSVAGFRTGAAAFGGGVIYSQLGPTGVFYDGSNIITDVRPTNELPGTFALEQNYPNPFNPSTTIKFSMPQTSEVTLKVYDMLGREVATLVNDVKPMGTYEVTWNAANLASGIYYYRMAAGSFGDVKKLILLK
ncbi:MAG: T9SS type A sorting domain-containing protein [Bacteroidetes bacterium]|nr:T9SS type A sorting domain-containing protein [Bacteroidota bacterium]MCW5896832.1 T9SS type A sorting domain-containing protein [Bacteroidota bacterium]